MHESLSLRTQTSRRPGEYIPGLAGRHPASLIVHHDGAACHVDVARIMIGTTRAAIYMWIMTPVVPLLLRLARPENFNGPGAMGGLAVKGGAPAVMGIGVR